ncbi:hypothetical protein NIASO_01740 [Niabella soli DSM 19437]|uniref:Uncharacterized protein n=1 Tax=Niabella soli DSM 19437 TaxID=929713 RepID=W0F274_9BACT|nr:hypothetical protein NIASO_01740 [Niabella soli DSM 19437]
MQKTKLPQSYRQILEKYCQIIACRFIIVHKNIFNFIIGYKAEKMGSHFLIIMTANRNQACKNIKNTEIKKQTRR